MIKVHVRGRESLPENKCCNNYVIGINDKTEQEVIDNIKEQINQIYEFIFIGNYMIRKDTIAIIEVIHEKEDVTFPKWKSNIDTTKYNIDNSEPIELKEDK